VIGEFARESLAQRNLGFLLHIRQRVAPKMQVMQEGPLRAAGAPDQADRDPEITP
jgi:hypothetical protein